MAKAEKCLDKKSNSCPLLNPNASPYMYQLGCRAQSCRDVNSSYYREWRKNRKAKLAKKRGRK